MVGEIVPCQRNPCSVREKVFDVDVLAQLIIRFGVDDIIVALAGLLHYMGVGMVNPVDIVAVSSSNNTADAAMAEIEVIAALAAQNVSAHFPCEKGECVRPSPPSRSPLITPPALLKSKRQSTPRSLNPSRVPQRGAPSSDELPAHLNEPKAHCAVYRRDFFEPANRIMTPWTLEPTEPDIAIAGAVARYTNRSAETFLRGLTWGADEKVLLGLACFGWLATRGQSEPVRRAGSHVLALAIATAMVPHAMKAMVDQTRPDRTTVVGHLHGVSLSGTRDDSFPSGHALHMGALASLATALPVAPRYAVQALAVGLSASRVLILAHWASDVITGFTLGAILERALRLVTGFPAPRKMQE